MITGIPTIGGISGTMGDVVNGAQQAQALYNLFNSAGRQEFEFKYELCPILLKNGIAKNLMDKLMPIIQLTQQQGYPAGSVSGQLVKALVPGYPPTHTGYFAHFKTVPGYTLMFNSIGTYPFANASVAGNAIIQQPVNVSLLMYCPATSAYPASARASIIASLMSALNEHVRAGGLFVVYTPLFIYDNCVLVGIRDGSEGDNAAMQNALIFDFMRPQIMTNEEAAGAQNELMSKLSKGQKL